MAVLYGAGAILTATSWDLGSFLAFRILTGIAVGASSAGPRPRYWPGGGRPSSGWSAS